MIKTRIEGLEGLKTLVGKELAPGPWHTMTFDDILKFAKLTGDQQWVHVDRARIANESPFGVPIAHGYLSLGMIGGLFSEAVEPVGFQMIVNYGLNKVRFPSPLKEGAEYRIQIKFNSVTPLDKGLEAVFVNTIEMRDEGKPACVAECVFRFYG